MTDGQTDILRRHCPRYAYASHGKNARKDVCCIFGLHQKKDSASRRRPRLPESFAYTVLLTGIAADISMTNVIGQTRSVMVLRPRRLTNIMLEFPQTLPTSDHHASSLLPIERKTLFQSGNCFQYLILFRPLLLAWIIYPLGSSVSEPQFSANHLHTCSINLCPHLQFHSSGNML